MMHTEEFEDYEEVIADGWLTVTIKADFTVCYSAYADGRLERIEYIRDVEFSQIVFKSASNTDLFHFNDSIWLRFVVQQELCARAMETGSHFRAQLEQMIYERIEKREAAAA